MLDREELQARGWQCAMAIQWEGMVLDYPDYSEGFGPVYEDTWGSTPSNSPTSSVGSTGSMQTPKHLKRGAAWRDSPSVLPPPGVKTDKSLLLDSCLLCLFSLQWLRCTLLYE